MSLDQLATNLRASAQATGSVTIASQIIISSQLVPPDGLDNAILAAYRLALGSTLEIVVSADAIPDPAADQTLTFTGMTALAPLKLAHVSATVRFDGSASPVQLTVIIDPGIGWVLGDSFTYARGYPFDDLLLTSPNFVFSSVALAAFAWNQQTIALAKGQNLAGLLSVARALGPIAPLLVGLAPAPFPFFGPIVVNLYDEQLVFYPELSLQGEIDATLVSFFGLSLATPSVALVIRTVYDIDDPTHEDPIQTPMLALGMMLAIEGAGALDFSTILVKGSSMFGIAAETADDPQAFTPAQLFQLFGGRNWYGGLPQALQQFLSAIQLKGFSVMLQPSSTGLNLLEVSAVVGSTGTWTLFDGLAITEFDAIWTVRSPGSAYEWSTVTLQAELAFFPSVFQGPIDITISSDLVISAAFDGQVKLGDLVSAISHGFVQLPSGVDVTFTRFGLMLDVENKVYQVSANVDVGIDLFGTKVLQLDDTGFQLQVAAPPGQPKTYDAQMGGAVYFGTFGINLQAAYDTTQGWTFGGAMLPGQTISLGAVVNTLLSVFQLPPFLPDALFLEDLALVVQPGTGTSPNRYSASGVLELKTTIGSLGTFDERATLAVAYDSSLPVPYSGSISVDVRLPALGAQVTIGYQFGQGSSVFLTWEGFTAAYDLQQLVKFQITNWSFGGLLTSLVKLITGDDTYQLPSPWDVLNQVSFKQFEIDFHLDTDEVDVIYTLPETLDLVFAKIRSFTLKKSDSVYLTLNMRLWNQNDYADQTFDVLKGPFPQPPGQGSNAFDLKFLGLGQHIGLPGLPAPTVEQAVSILSAMAVPDPTKLPVGGPGQPTFDSTAGWLVATHFTLMDDTVDVQAVFADPTLYGLRIELAGEGAKIFDTLVFEVMYRKITDTVGVYELDLKLPEAMRHLEFGAVSILLPAIGVQIYTNGDFQIDLGYPWNNDFTRSFTIQAFPFIGAGGLYFAKLSAATATHVPQTTLGSFSPVIEFGFGASLGVGKQLSAGPLEAGLSVSVFGTLTGVIAKWHSYSGLAERTLGDGDNSDVATSYFFHIEGTIGVIGRLYGSIDFGIVQAAFDLTLAAWVRLEVEAFRAAHVTIAVSVRVELAIRINLGLFKITIHLSFSTTISTSFAIGSDAHAPWDAPLPLRETYAARLAARAAAYDRHLAWIGWPALAADDSPPTITLTFAPHTTVASDGSGTLAGQTACYAAMLYIDAPQPDQPATGTTSFEILAREVLLWAVNTFADSQPGSPTPTRRALLDTVIARTQLEVAFEYLAASSTARPITYAQIESGLLSQLAVKIQPPTADVPSASFFPMVPELELVFRYQAQAPLVDVHFDQTTMCDGNYLASVRAWLQAAMARYQNAAEQAYGNGAEPASSGLRSRLPRPATDPAQQESLATFLFEDYVLLIARHMLQGGLDAMDAFTSPITTITTTIAQIVAWANSFGIGTSFNTLTAAIVGQANRTLAVSLGAPLVITGIQHQVAFQPTGSPPLTETLGSIAATYLVTPLAIVTFAANLTTEGLLAAGAQLVLPAGPYTVLPRDTFASIQQQTGVDLPTLTAAVSGLAGGLAPLAVLAMPPIPYVTVAGDTLGGIASTWGTTPAQLAIDNAAVPELFGPGAALALPGLVYLPVSAIDDQITRSGSVTSLSGMAARFLLAGLRIPTPASPSTTESLYALTGQQFALPALDPTRDAGQYAVELHHNTAPAWLTLVAPDPTQLVIPVGADDITRINAILATATTKPGLPAVIDSLTPLPTVAQSPRRWILTTSIALQSPDPIAFAVHPAPPPSIPATPVIRQLPDALVSLVSGRATPPRCTLRIGAGNSELTDPPEATTYAWATLVDLTIKKIPTLDGTAGTAPDLYELVGADGVGTTLLERLLAAIGTGANPVGSLTLCYRPAVDQQQPQGLMSDGMQHLTAFVVKVNLSTETNPPSALLQLRAGATPTGILNSTTEFLQLVWEASVTRSGGFYLDYSAGGAGLPDTLFGKDQCATISLVVLYSEVGGLLRPYMNCAVTGDHVGSDQIMFVRSERQTPAYAAVAGDSLASIADAYELAVTDVAAANSQVALASGVSLAITDVLYELAPGDTLASVAAAFAVTPAAIQTVNPGVDWTAIGTFTLLAIPDLAYEVPPGASLGSIATRFGVSITGLGWANRGVPALFEPATALTIPDQIVDNVALIPPGNVGYRLIREPASPDDGDDPATFLLTQFNLLASCVAANVSFAASNEVIPIGPRQATDTGDDWVYEQVLAIAPFATPRALATQGSGLPSAQANPYAGVGSAAQLHLTWGDLFGNRSVSSLDDPTLAPAQPLNDLPIRVRYSDRIVGLGSWPSIMTDYAVTGTGTGSGSIVMSLTFDPSRYGNPPPPPLTPPPDPPAWYRRALADREVYRTAFYQINQLYSDGSPAVQLVVTSTIDGGVPHALAGTDLTNVRAFVGGAFLYLDGLITPSPIVPPAPPAPVTIAMPIVDDNPEEVYALELSFTIQRDPRQVDDLLKDDATVVASATTIKPQLVGTTLDAFVAGLEQAYDMADHQLKVASGLTLEDVSGGDESGKLWIVRIAKQPGRGIYFQLQPQAGFFAPQPLSTSLISRDGVPIHPYAPGIGVDWNTTTSTTFTGVDLDAWASQCLDGLDEVLSARIAVPAFAVDYLGATARALPLLLQIKQALAGAIAPTVVPILTSPTPQPGNVADASEKLRQQLLSKLGNAYGVAAIVQLDVTITSPWSTANSPRLFGQPVVTSDPGTTADYTISSGKIPLTNGGSYLSVAFTAKHAEDQRQITLDNLGFQITHLEREIAPVPGIDGYQTSSWLGFVAPLPVATIGTTAVPIALRSYPTAPSLIRQQGTSAVSGTDPVTTLEQATLWSYELDYRNVTVAQDTIESTVEWNVPDPALRLRLDQSDLFDQLAQFVTVWPQLERVLATVLTTINLATDPKSAPFQQAQRALSDLVRLTQGLAAAWTAWCAGAPPRRLGASQDLHYDLSIASRQFEAPDGTLALAMQLAPAMTSTAPLAPPTLGIDGYLPVPADQPTWVAFQDPDGKYLSWSDARARNPDRSITFAQLDVMAYQNALSSIWIVRNQDLVDGNPTSDRFLYSTPVIRFASKLTPLIDLTNRIDVAALAPGQQLPLWQHLRNLFSTLLRDSAATSTNVALESTFALAIGDPAIVPLVPLPVLYRPPFQLQIPADYSPPSACAAPWDPGAPFICKLASALLDWYGRVAPQATSSEFRIDLTMYSTLTNQQLPLIRLRSLVLDVSAIEDLPSPTPGA